MARRSHRQLAFFSVAKQAMRSSSGRPERGLNGLSPIACDVSSLGASVSHWQCCQLGEGII